MKKILCLFDYGEGCMTGYATVSRNIVSELKKQFSGALHLDIIAVNYFGAPYEEYGGTVRVKSAKLSQDGNAQSDQFKNGDDFGRLVFLKELVNTEYDGIFFIGDLGSIAGMIGNLREVRDIKKANGHKDFKSVIYFPVDGKLHLKVKNELFDKEKLKILPKERQHYFKEYIKQMDELSFFDTIVTYTNYAKKEITTAAPYLKGHDVKVIYHGINTEDFFPMEKPDIKKFRKKYFGKNAHKFIIGVVNRNQTRKDIPTSIMGFVEAKKNWDKSLPEPFLYLHMNPKDPNGWNLYNVLSLIPELEEGRDYMFSVGDHNGQVDVQTLNSIYNSLDVYLSTARGGGFELSVIESMACKIPCIIPNHTSMGEIAGDNERAYLLEEFLPVCDVSDNIIRNMCHYEEISEKLIKVSTADNEEIISAAYKWVTALTWESICKEWTSIFQQTFKL